MKINKLKLHPFAGTKNRTVDFTPGLNVILGANEAGKSTLIKGLSCLFFTAPDLTPSKFKSELSSFLPLSGGDTIRISADIDLQGENYHLEKEFGAVKRAQLILPTNAELNSITEVQKQLLGKLGFSKATYEQVLITHQSDLANTINTLKNGGGDTKTTLSDNLRKKSYELDGISVQKLKAEIDREVKDFFNNWDENTNLPRDRKDFDNPHKSNVGNILKAYYTYRKLEKQLADAEKYEQEIDLVNAKLQDKRKKHNELVSYKLQFAPVVEDARQRQILESKLKTLLHEKTAIAEVAEKWPVEQNKFLEAKRKNDEISQGSKVLETNIKALKQYLKSQELRTLYEKAKILCDEFVTEQENFKLIPQVNSDHINHVRKLERELDKLKNIIEAQELKIAIRAKKDVSFGLKRGLNLAENVSFSEGEMIQYDAAGRIQIEHEDFTIAVVSGKADIKQILKDIETKQAEIATYFKIWNVGNLDALDSLKSDYDKASLQIQSKHNEIKKLLNGQKLADLEKEVSAIEKPHITESLEMLQVQFNELQKQLTELQTIERYAAKQLQEWEKKFISKDNLLDKLLENKSELSKIEKQISNLKCLPENITDSQIFLDEFNRKNAELDKIQNEIISLKEQRLELDRKQPEDSTEDLQYNLTLEKKEFENTLQKGKAYKRIQTELDSILKDLDKDTFTPLKERTEYYFHKLTGGKYNTVKMQETIPSEIELNGTWLPENLLSTGTLDLLALATRLAMADFYLEDKSGFIVLDDPLVNLDPARQEMAAKCLREIAETKQVIVLTCHPSHAAMLQGDLIEL